MRTIDLFDFVQTRTVTQLMLLYRTIDVFYEISHNTKNFTQETHAHSWTIKVRPRSGQLQSRNIEMGLIIKVCTCKQIIHDATKKSRTTAKRGSCSKTDSTTRKKTNQPVRCTSNRPGFTVCRLLKQLSHAVETVQNLRTTSRCRNVANCCANVSESRNN